MGVRKSPVYFTLGCLPPTLNEITDTARRSRYKSATMKRQWTDYVRNKALSLPSMQGEVYLECVWFIKNFSRDPDNVKAASKFIMDGIVNAGKLTDDKLSIIQSPIIHWFTKVTNHDSLVFILYDEAQWNIRRKRGIIQPDVPQPIREVPDFPTRKDSFIKKKRPSRKATKALL